MNAHRNGTSSLRHRLLTRPRRLAALTLLLTTCVPFMHPQEAAVQVLQHHVRSVVSDHRAALVNRLDGATQLHLSLVLPLRNQAALATLLQQLYDPASPQYRHFLTVAQFTEQFGPTQQDYDAVAAYLRPFGLVTGTAPANRLLVPVSGSAAQIETAFHVQMNVYQHPTESRTFFSTDREPSLRLGVAVAHISGLDNYSLPQPRVQRRSASAVAAPSAITGSGPGGSYLGSDMRAAYYGGTQLDGTGQAVGVLEFGGYDPNDVTLTFTNAGQTNSVPINNVLLDGASVGSIGVDGDGEQVLDIVQAIGMAPNLSQVRVYIGIGGDDPSVINAMASENIAKQLSCSWGWSPVDPTVDDVFFQEMAVQGQSFFTASGDNGAYDALIDPIAYPAEDQYVTAVGGTHLTTNGAGGAWTSEVVWNSGGGGSGGGISPDGIPLPSYQSGLANSANGGSATLRNYPDVAMEADFDNYNCQVDGCAGGWGGTSFAAPRWAAFMALVNQQAAEAGTAPAGGIGFLNPPLYVLAQGSNASNDLHDIVSGNNKTENQPIWYSAVVGYDLTTGWGSPAGQSLINDLAGQQTPGFWLSAGQGTVQANPGGSGTEAIRITDAGGFSGNVNLAVTSTLPSGVTAAFASNSAAATDLLTFTVGSSVAVQNIPVTVTGTSGSLTQSLALTLSINTPSFNLVAAPAYLIVKPGATITSTVTVLPQYGFTGNVALAMSGLPTGVTASFSPTSTTGSSTLTLTASASATGGVSTLTITGTSGNLTATTSAILAVNAPSFELYSTISNITMGVSSSAAIDIEVFPLNGFTGNVTLAATNLPSGVTATFSPNPTSGYSVLTFTTSSTAALGTSTITITGTSGSITASTTLTLKVVPPSFALSTYPNPMLGQGTSASTAVTIQGSYGFSGNVTLSVSGLPTGVTPIWSSNPATTSSTLYLYATATAPVGQYPLTITGTSGTLTANTTLSLTVSAPSFTMPSLGTFTMGTGSTGTDFGYIQRLYGFSGNVALSVSGLPSGVTASVTPNPITGSSTYYDILFQTSSSVAIGQYPLTITGTSGSQTVTATLTLAIVNPSFILYGGSLSVGQGSSGSSYVEIEQMNGFTGSVNLSISGLPSGVTASFSPNPATTYSSITLTASSTAPVGQYTLTITGSSGSQTQTTTLYLTIGASTFTLTAYNLTIGQGSSSSSTVYLYDSYGFNGAVTLSASGLPSGVTATFQSNPTTSSSLITFNAASNVPAGQYPITITGTSGSLTATTTITLTVGAPSFTLFIGSYPAPIAQGSTGYTYVYVQGQYGFSNSVNLSISGLPSGVTATFQPNPATSSSEILFTVASNATPGTSTLTITGTFGSQTQTTTMQLTVAAPTFSLSDYLNATVNQGSTATSTVTIGPEYGFAGSVTLSASGLPSGVTAAFSPNPATATSTITFTASATATPGNQAVTITGTSGTITNSTQIELHVSAASFSLTAAPSTISVAPGGFGRSTISILPVNGFTGPVSLSLSGLPTGVTAAFAPATATTGSVLTLSVGSSATAGSSTVTITGTSGADIATMSLTLNILGATQSATSTSLSFTSNGSPVTTVSAGTAVTATAAVTTGSTPLSLGLVYLCNATATYCDALHQLATAQLNSSGNAAFLFVPGAGVRSYKAVFAGTSTLAGSSSASAPLTVTALLPTTTTLSQSGSAGNYTVTATVTGQGDVAPTGNVSFIDTTASNDALASAALVSGSATVTQTAGPQTTVGLYSTPIVTADFNGDGIPDLAIASTIYSTVSVLLGSSAGSFTTSSTLSLSTTTSSMAVGDFNRDGEMDLALINSSNDTISLYYGNGDGTFTLSALPIYTLPQPSKLLVADVNGDGLLDIIVLCQYGGEVEVLLGNGSGGFTPSNFTSSAAGAQSVVVADFNGDGIPDLAVANYNYNESLTVLLGNGDGSFTATPTVSAPEYISTIVVGDFNQDGKPDLAVGTSQTPGALYIYLGNGDGTFASPSTALPNSNPGSFVVADFNSDGKPDLMVEDSYNEKQWILLGNGDGTFTTGSSISLTQGGNLVAADWNGDGLPDAAVLGYSSSNVEVYFTHLAQISTAIASKVSPFGTGQHLIDASYPGNTTYAGSTSSTVSLTAAAGPPTVTVTPPLSAQTTQPFTVSVTISAGQGYSVPTGSATLISGSYTSGTMVLTSGSASFSVPAGALPAGSNTLTVNYTPDTASAATYTSATGSATLVVTAGAPAITWPTPAPITYGTALSATQLNAAASVPGIFVYNPAAGAVLLPGQQILSVTFTPADSTDYTAATASVTLAVNDVAARFSVTGIPAQVDPGVAYSATVTALGVLGAPYSGFTGTVALSGSSSLSALSPVSYTFTGSDAGVHTFQVTFPAEGVYSVTATSGSLTGTEPNILALDYVWLVNGNGTLSQLDAAGSAISSSAGYSGAGSAAGAAAIDASGDVWSLSPSANAVVEYTSTGVPRSSSSGYTGAGLSSPSALAIDGSGQVFVANANGTISVLGNSGAAVSPATGYTGGNMSTPTGIAVDSSGRVWVANGNNSVTEIIGAGAVPVATPTSSAVQNNSLGVQP